VNEQACEPRRAAAVRQPLTVGPGRISLHAGCTARATRSSTGRSPWCSSHWLATPSERAPSPQGAYSSQAFSQAYPRSRPAGGGPARPHRGLAADSEDRQSCRSVETLHCCETAHRCASLRTEYVGAWLFELGCPGVHPVFRLFLARTPRHARTRTRLFICPPRDATPRTRTSQFADRDWVTLETARNINAPTRYKQHATKIPNTWPQRQCMNRT
jgi:hypothetical protein